MPQPKRTDPTVTSATGEPYPEGTHPARAPSDVTHSATKITYREADDKPDPTSIVQIAEIPEGWLGA